MWRCRRQGRRRRLQPAGQSCIWPKEAACSCWSSAGSALRSSCSCACESVRSGAPLATHVTEHTAGSASSAPSPARPQTVGVALHFGAASWGTSSCGRGASSLLLRRRTAHWDRLLVAAGQDEALSPCLRRPRRRPATPFSTGSASPPKTPPWRIVATSSGGWPSPRSWLTTSVAPCAHTHPERVSNRRSGSAQVVLLGGLGFEPQASVG